MKSILHTSTAALMLARDWVNQFKLETNQWQSGIYTVAVKADGKVIQSKKLVVNHK
jgi:hypothetical protein